MSEFADDASGAAFRSAMDIDNGDDDRIEQKDGDDDRQVLYRRQYDRYTLYGGVKHCCPSFQSRTNPAGAGEVRQESTAFHVVYRIDLPGKIAPLTITVPLRHADRGNPYNRQREILHGLFAPSGLRVSSLIR